MKNMKICKHSNGRGYCFLKEEYCVEGPCKDEELIEYAPVARGKWLCDASGKYICSNCEQRAFSTCNELTAESKYYTTDFCHSCGADMRKAVE